MSEWGKYFKSAVANVEQRLDKVLAENNGNPLNRQLSKPSRTGGSLGSQERSEPAVSVRTSEDSGARLSLDSRNWKEGDGTRDDSSSTNSKLAHAGPNADVRSDDPSNYDKNLTVSQFVIPPDTSTVISLARQLALAVKRDDADLLLNEIENFQKRQNEYVESVSQRINSTSAKLALISADYGNDKSGNEKRIALLIEEGQKLSQHELKLGLILKKLRAEKQQLSEQLASKGQLQETTKDQKEEIANLKSKVRDAEALNEHYRSQLDATPVSGPTSDQSGLENSQKHFAQEKANWHSLETKLLSRIVELEQVSDLYNTSKSHLQQSLAAALRQARTSEDQAVSLQDEVDQLKESQHQEVTSLITKIESLEKALQIKDQSLRELNQETELETSSLCKEVSKTEVADPELSAPEGFIEEEPEITTPKLQQTSSGNVTPNESEVHTRFRKHTFDQKNIDIEALLGPTDPNIDHQTVGPSGPFGENALSEQDNTSSNFGPSHGTFFDQELPLENDNVSERRFPDTSFGPSIASSRRSLDDSFSFLEMSKSRQDSSADSLNPNSNTYLVQKLTVTVHKLRHELISAHREAKFANQQRNEAQKEIVQYVNTAEQLASKTAEADQLKETVTALEKELSQLKEIVTDKNEQIDELEADVRDLKEMYKEQIETLISQIEKMKS